MSLAARLVPRLLMYWAFVRPELLEVVAEFWLITSVPLHWILLIFLLLVVALVILNVPVGLPEAGEPALGVPAMIEIVAPV